MLCRGQRAGPVNRLTGWDEVQGVKPQLRHCGSGQSLVRQMRWIKRATQNTDTPDGAVTRAEGSIKMQDGDQQMAGRRAF